MADQKPASTAPSNSKIADHLEHVADLLEQTGGNEYRAASYRRAARTVRTAERSAAELVAAEGQDGLKAWPGIGEKLAGAIEQFISCGRLGVEQRLEAKADPVALLARVPQMGETLARRVHEQLGIDSLEALERAAHDGRLLEVEGMGDKKVQGIRDALAGMLSTSKARRARRRQAKQPPPEKPSVKLLLEIDAEYRREAEAGRLRTIAPRRFNPTGEPWLPILETCRDGWSFTVLFSNTARAHEAGTTRDWVVLYYQRDGRQGQCTVVTSPRGPLEGRRVVRGRERQCRDLYDTGRD